MKHTICILAAVLWMTSQATAARTCHLTKTWHALCQVLDSRVNQIPQKMKLKASDADNLECFLQETPYQFHYLNDLQTTMPKTTVELLMAVQKRGVSEVQANLMAQYLIELVKQYRFQNLAAFDNNTSHIIGRDWPEIDYSGEAMTWQKQKQKYAPYGISNFKSVENLKKFFPVESKLPYFSKTYHPIIK